MTTTDTTTNQTTASSPETSKTSAHPFAHLGPAPYRFVGMFRMPSMAAFGDNLSGYNMALSMLPKMDGGYGSCSHCSTPIANVYVIECGDKTRWGVGCDCIFKLDGVSSRTLCAEVKKAKQAEDKKTRHAKEDAKIAAGREWLAENETALRDIPHPNQYRAGKGDTYFDYVNFCVRQSGVSGEIRMIATAKKKLAEVEAEQEMEARADQFLRQEAETAMGWTL